MVIIDALTQREWVREDYIPSHEGGVRDSQVLAHQIKNIPSLDPCPLSEPRFNEGLMACRVSSKTVLSPVILPSIYK